MLILAFEDIKWSSCSGVHDRGTSDREDGGVGGMETVVRTVIAQTEDRIERGR